ncbi:MAG: hypothetical protein ABEJ84_04545, partial [Halodesulfurarchaeum sp.]
MGNIHDVPRWVWGTTLVGVGFCLTLVHLYHYTQENPTLAMIIGVIIPIVLSLVVMWVGFQIIRNREFQEIAPWLTGWMLLGMGWMAIAGTGAVLYESAKGASLSHTSFLILIFATYGCLPGLFTGWYDG